MTARILWQHPDGSISVTTPVADPIKEESEIEFVARMLAASNSVKRPAETLDAFFNRLVETSGLPRDPGERLGSYVQRMLAATNLVPIRAETDAEFIERLKKETGLVRVRAETGPEYLDRIANRLLEPQVDKTGATVPSQFASAVRLHDVDHSALPADRRFRACWRHNGQAVVVDPVLARAQVAEEVRQNRNKLLTESDALKAYVDDTGTAADKKAMADYRQALRDLPATVAPSIASASVSDLASFSPTLPTKPAKAQTLKV